MDKFSTSSASSVARFQEYLRIKTVQPDPDYASAKRFLLRQADELGLPCQVIELVADKPIIIMTWEGQDPELSSVILNSHTDVVPVFPEFWKYDPFSAHRDENGDIFARGAQDMKCVGIQYLEAIRRLKERKFRPKRTFHLTFVPDEEIGGPAGMGAFVERDEFKNLRAGFALDEGQANPTEAVKVYYGERPCWWVDVTCSGNPGHGSRFIEGDAGSKMRRVINAFMDFRDKEEERLKNDPKLKLGDVTTLNLGILSGGVQPNVLPVELKAVFDIRIALTVNLTEFENTIRSWCEQAGEGVTYELPVHGTCQAVTSTSDSDPWWSAFSGACKRQGLILETEVFPAATDSSFLREVGVPALGFSPMNNTPVLLHDHNEFLNEKVFLRGIEVYTEIIQALGSVSGDS